MSLTLAPRLGPRPPADGHPADPARSLLARLADGAEALPAFTPLVVPPADRTPAEAEAAAHAAACPDLFLVHAPDHPAGERLIADIARLSADAPVLVLSPDPAAADRITERLSKAVPVVRALADDENPARPSPVVSRLTSTARLEQARRDADAAAAAADSRLASLEALGEQAERLARLDARVAELAARRAAVEGQVRDEADGKTATAFTRRLGTLPAGGESAEITRERAGLASRRSALQDSLGALRQRLADAGGEGAKKSGIIGWLLGRNRNAADPAELEKQVHAQEAELAAIDTSLAELGGKLESHAAASRAERERSIREEVSARLNGTEADLAAATAERDRLRAELAAGANPEEQAAAKHAAARSLVEAKELAAALRRAEPGAVRRAAGPVAVVVGTPGSLYADRVFDRDPSAGGTPPFDLLVLDRAEELTEPDFVQLARLARRWVLVGDIPADEPPRPYLNGSAPRHAGGRNGRPAEPPFALRLARVLDRRRWAAEGNWLVYRLEHPGPGRRVAVTREPLLDRPEIELRFLAGDGGKPVLAEVAFPASMPAAEAKAFLFAHLNEVLLRPCGPLSWQHAPDAVTARWAGADHPDAAWIDLEPGVRERVVGRGHHAFTAAVSFDTAAGWDAEKSAAWLEERLPAATCRFAVLPRPSRHG